MTPRSPDRGLYLHVPFCHARCGYCDFVTFTGKEDRIAQYVEDLCQEISLHRAQDSVVSPLRTIFFGGGTPSLLEPSHTQRILKAAGDQYGIDARTEITLEANPESITLEKAKGWRQSGINRLSIGLQAFDDVLLKAADRLHTVKDFLNAYAACRDAGFDNINIDLIYGLPGQTLEQWKETVLKTAALSPEHLSIYSLKVEEHTPFAAQGIVINEDVQADMFEWSRQYLQELGYSHYEVSNFSKPGYECHHNLIYWRQQDYIGAGVGAVGCVAGVRWENHKNLLDYGRDIAAGKLPKLSSETLSAETRRFEQLMLGLRLREGMAWDESNPEWIERRSALAARQLLEQTPAGLWRVPDHAVLFTHQVLLPFLG